MNREMVWLSGIVPSYQQAEAVFDRIGHQHVPHSTIWRQGQVHGERLKACVEQQQARVKPERVVLPKADQDHDMVKGVTMDGGMVHIRDEGWKEFKAGAVFDVEMSLVTDPETGEEVEKPCAVNTRYTAVLGEVERFAPALWHLAVEADVPTAARSSVTADGAAWIWNLAADYFPDSEQIVDWYHATEHLADAAHALHPDDADKAKAWYKRWQTPLFEGEAWRLAQTLARADLPDQAQYFENHKRRMRYQHFRADGFPIGSGTVESACKQFKARLTGPGMRWSRPGAERMLVIRSAVMDHAFDALWAAAA
jgi:hypothetical protein